ARYPIEITTVYPGPATVCAGGSAGLIRADIGGARARVAVDVLRGDAGQVRRRVGGLDRRAAGLDVRVGGRRQLRVVVGVVTAIDVIGDRGRADHRIGICAAVELLIGVIPD